MKTILLETTNVCAHTAEQQPKYVFYTGGIAGMSDSSTLEGNPKPFDGGSDEIELDRHRVHGV
jgi:hypothetical protein